MNRLFRDILRENKNDYIRTVLGCSWIISLIYFRQQWVAVFHTYQQDPSSNDIFDHGSRKRISYSIWFTVDPADLTVERIHKKKGRYIQNVNCIRNEKKA